MNKKGSKASSISQFIRSFIGEPIPTVLLRETLKRQRADDDDDDERAPPR